MSQLRRGYVHRVDRRAGGKDTCLFDFRRIAVWFRRFSIGVVGHQPMMTTGGPHVPQHPMLIPLQWVGLFATLAVFAVMLAVVTVPASVAILDWIFAADFTVTPCQIGRQVFFAQLLPMALGAALRGVRPSLGRSWLTGYRANVVCPQYATSR